MMVVVDLSPEALAQTMFGKEVHRMAQVPVTGPALVARPLVGLSSDFAFASPAGYRRAAGQALQSLGPFLEAPAVITDFGHYPRSKLRPGAWQRPKQVMVGMTTEKFLDALAVDAKLFFQRKEHADQRECQLAFGIGHRHSATQLDGVSKEFQPARA